MLFEFIKYISPTWYYNLRPVDQLIPYFIDYRKLSNEEQRLLDIDKDYSTEEGKLADAAYQAWQKGIIKKSADFSLFKNDTNETAANKRTIELFSGRRITVNQEVYVKNIPDNYRFIRRFFNPVFGFYILLLRLLSLHNPTREINGFIRSLQIKKINLYNDNYNSALHLKEYEAYISSLIDQNPKISVIIPTLNRYQFLKNTLEDLENQKYKNFEVIVCDQSDNLDENFYKGWQLDIVLIKQQEKALWLARNTCIKLAKSDYIAFSEDDVRIEPDWLIQHLKCIDYFEADISAGVFFPEGNKIPNHKKYFKWAEQFATGNALVKKNIFYQTGLFDRQFEKQRSGDGEFGLRSYLLNFTSISNPMAFCEDVKAPTGGLRQMGSWDSFRPTKLLAPRPIPSVLYLGRKYFENHFALLMLLYSVPASVVPYKYKNKKGLKYLAFATLIITWPIIFLQVFISWNKASLKLKGGNKIEKL